MKDFVNAHFLKENDLLVFKYIVASRLDVSIYDSQSSCEIESSFYINGREHTDNPSGCRTKKCRVVGKVTTNTSSEA